jgi:dCMP deaminase
MIHSQKWQKFFLGLADHAATMSKDPSTKVGAVLVDDRRRVVGIGYNGFPDRIPDDCEALNDRETKLSLMIHAEPNAILNCPIPTRGLHLYVTHPPCSDCAKFIIQAGIVSVTAWSPDAVMLERWSDSFARSQSIYDMAKIPLILLDFNCNEPPA